jgi:hypothetical protein
MFSHLSTAPDAEYRRQPTNKCLFSTKQPSPTQNSTSPNLNQKNSESNIFLDNKTTSSDLQACEKSEELSQASTLASETVIGRTTRKKVIISLYRIRSFGYELYYFVEILKDILNQTILRLYRLTIN